MKNITIYTLIGAFLFILFWGVSSHAGILSQSYRIPAYVLNGGGLQGASENFYQVASIGESTPTGFSQSVQFKNYAGFIHQIGMDPIPIEICDGIDNDGDGQVDEDLVRACTTQCGTGTETCENGKWGICVPPCDEEICDGIDNDGDGQIDEDLVRACTTQCGTGTETCENGKWGICVPPCPECNATRSAPGYTPGSYATITIEATPETQTSGYSVEDSPPIGWPVSDINEGGTWDGVNKKVKWGPFLDNTQRTLTYKVEAPSDATGSYPLSGSACFDGVDQSICGDAEINDKPTHPADMNVDWCLVIGEVTKYAAEWKKGKEWPIPPNPIPISYVTRACYIWKVAECYYYIPEPPTLCWEAVTTRTRARRREMSDMQTLNHGFDPSSYLPGQPVEVTIEAIPAPSTAAYSLEDIPPDGWLVSDINEGGTWDSVNKKIKWGPFFDNQQRTFTYIVKPPLNASGTKGFYGVFSPNGTDFNIDRQIKPAVPCVEEVCDGKDNDCDGEIDEDLTRTTTCGVGECAGNTGIETCSAGIWTGDTCDPLAGSFPEVCDALDNDCDGHVDEDLVQDCSNSCGQGTKTCVNGQWGNCTAPPPPCDGDCNATRSAPGYAPESSVTIIVDVIPESQTPSYTVEDTPPDGWLVSEINEGGIWDGVNKKVKWGPFFDNTSRTLTYNVKAPSDANGCYPLSGYASFDGVNQSICGDVEICEGMILPPGWSMISLPMIPDNATLSALFPEALVMYMYEKEAGYVRVKGDDELEAGRGYWILLNDAQSYSIKGQPIQEYTLPVHKDGWELIGGCSSPAQASADNCNIGVIYGFDKENGYIRIPEGGLLEPCKGYWIFISDTNGQPELRVTTQF